MTDRNDSRANGRWNARLTLSIVLAFLALVFVFSNVHPVPIGFFGITFTLPMWIWFVLLLVVGILIGWMRPGSRKE